MEYFCGHLIFPNELIQPCEVTRAKATQPSPFLLLCTMPGHPCLEEEGLCTSGSEISILAAGGNNIFLKCFQNDGRQLLQRQQRKLMVRSCISLLAPPIRVSHAPGSQVLLRSLIPLSQT